MFFSSSSYQHSQTLCQKLKNIISEVSSSIHRKSREIDCIFNLRVFQSMNSILISGCNRGLGLGLVRSLLKIESPPEFIFATCRNIEKAEVSCHGLTFSNRCHYYKWDNTKFDSDFKQLKFGLKLNNTLEEFAFKFDLRNPIHSQSGKCMC